MLSLQAISQDPGPNLKFSGNVDTYFALYSDSVGVGNLQKFAVASPISNKFSLNAAMFTASFNNDIVRSKMSVVYGDIPIGSWTTKLNMIVEANAGVKLVRNVWVDAGIFRTHLGFESVFPMDNVCVSSAWGSYVEPVYQAGAKLSFAPTNKLDFCIHVLNGYNLIEETNSKKSVGLTMNYHVNDNLSLSYNNLYGSDAADEDTIDHNRFYNTLFISYQNNNWTLAIGGDAAMQQNADLVNSNRSATMFSNLMILKYQATEKFDAYMRGEYFKDDNGFMSGTITNSDGEETGLKLWGGTLGGQFKPTENSYVRAECRRIQMDSKQNIFHWNNHDVNNRMEFHVDFGITF